MKKIRIKKIVGVNEEKNIFVEIIRIIFECLGRIGAGTIYLGYLIIHNINKLVSKLYNKMPYAVRVLIIYIMLGMIGINYLNPKTEIIYKNVINNQPLVIEFTKNDDGLSVESIDKSEEGKETSQKDLKVCKNETACKIYDRAIEKGATHEQALIIVAISRHETGAWTSYNFKTNNNLGGIMSNGTIKKYASFNDGLDGMINLLLNNYFGKGLDTIEKIGNKYCPVGQNDKGDNKYWIPKVTQFYNEYLED